MNLVRLIFATFPEGRAGWALLLLRVFVGTAFFFHGGGKVNEIAQFAAEFSVPEPLAALAAYSQLIAAFLLLPGLATPLAAGAIGGTMTVAVFKLIERGEAFVNPHGHSWEASGFYLVAAVVLLLCGPGAYSVDAMVLRGAIGVRPWGPFTGLLLCLSVCSVAAAQPRFRADDPVRRELPPKDTGDLAPRRIDQYYDFYRNTFQSPGEPSTVGRPVIAAQDVNTLGEVLDGAWFTNRNLSHEEIVRGPNRPENAPDLSGRWTVIGAKTEGVTPGLLIRDPKGRRYLLKFDPLSNPEMATGADVVSAKLLHAIGYHVPENYIVKFDRNQLVAGADTQFTDRFGKRRGMTERDVSELLLRVPRVDSGPEKNRIRAVASLYLSGKPIGPFKYYGRRKGDRNDDIRHEHRRSLRGFHVVSAWLAHHDSRSVNSLDMLVEDNGVRWVKHHLIDFGSTLGSAATKSKSAREGNAYLYDFPSAAQNFLTLGLRVRDWETAKYRYYPAVGRLEYTAFDPDKWVPNYRNRAFLNRLPEDEFWAAEKIGRLTDADLRDVVATGEYSDAKAAAWLAECLIRRRDAIVKAYSRRLLPLHAFEVAQGSLVFRSLDQRAGKVNLRWHSFDNESGRTAALGEASGPMLPPGDGWRMAELSEPGRSAVVRVFLRGQQIVGIERTVE